MKFFLIIFTVVLTLSCAFSAHAAPNDGPYWTQLKYYDSIQIRYMVEHVPGTLDAVTGDIPIGGLSGSKDGTDCVIQQLYCVDARVPFHSYAAKGGYTTWPKGVTTDTVPNYQPATPLVLSDAARANLNQIYWVVINGFHGTGYDAKTQAFENSNTEDIRAKL
jgi:hypothetical protein